MCIIYISYELGKRNSIPQVIDELENYIQKKPEIQQYTDNIEIIIDDDVIEILSMAWEAYDIEYAFSLDGHIYNTTYYIDTIKAKKISFANESQVTATPDRNSLISIHSHPNGTCGLSEGDILAHLTRIENFSVRSDQLTAVQCGKESFIFYYYEEYDKPIRWYIN